MQICMGEPFLPYVMWVKKIEVFTFGKSGISPNIHILWLSFLQLGNVV